MVFACPSVGEWLRKTSPTIVALQTRREGSPQLGGEPPATLQVRDILELEVRRYYKRIVRCCVCRPLLAPLQPSAVARSGVTPAYPSSTVGRREEHQGAR